MPAPLSEAALDAILALQFTVAWAGEGRCSPRRLGWWDTDLIDADGGGDLLARLLPQTHAWAALDAVREAARQADARARSKMADPDQVRSLFFLGFELDEQLSDRLASLKHTGQAPAAALSLPLPLTADFSRDQLLAALHRGDAAFTVLPGGRQLKGRPPAAPEAMIAQLAAALAPLSDQYPLPFFKLQG